MTKRFGKDREKIFFFIHFMKGLAVFCVSIISIVFEIESNEIQRFKTKEQTFKVDALDETDQHVHLFYPMSPDDDTIFPFVSYAHGWLGGNEIDINGYYDFFHQLASYGFVVGGTLLFIEYFVYNTRTQKSTQNDATTRHTHTHNSSSFLQHRM